MAPPPFAPDIVLSTIRYLQEVYPQVTGEYCFRVVRRCGDQTGAMTAERGFYAESLKGPDHLARIGEEAPAIIQGALQMDAGAER